MADIRTFVKNIVREVLKAEYPMIGRMHCVTARIKEVRHSANIFYYTVRPLDETGNEDLMAAELPNLASDQEYSVGDTVVIQYVAGIHPYLVGRWYM